MKGVKDKWTEVVREYMRLCGVEQRGNKIWIANTSLARGIKAKIKKQKTYFICVTLSIGRNCNVYGITNM